MRRIWFLWLSIPSLIGCGGAPSDQPALAPVSGVVKLDGQPLANAKLVFQPTGEGRTPSIAQTDDQGAFELTFNRQNKGAVLGKHQVRITTEGIIADDNGKETEIPEKVPARYNTKTELEYEVKETDNVFEISLGSGKTPVR